MYNKKTIKYFKNLKHFGSIKNANGIGKAGNIICGDFMILYLKIEKKKNKEIIKDIKFQTYGCLAAIATSSVVCELAKGKEIKKALEITNQKINEILGGLPPIKTHCSLLAVDALKEAIYDYLKKNNKEIPDDLEENHKRILKEQEIIEKKLKILAENASKKDKK